MGVGEQKFYHSIKPKRKKKVSTWSTLKGSFKSCKHTVITFQTVLKTHVNYAQYQGLYSSVHVLVTKHISTEDFPKLRQRVSQSLFRLHRGIGGVRMTHRQATTALDTLILVLCAYTWMWVYWRPRIFLNNRLEALSQESQRGQRWHRTNLSPCACAVWLIREEKRTVLSLCVWDEVGKAILIHENTFMSCLKLYMH